MTHRPMWLSVATSTAHPPGDAEPVHRGRRYRQAIGCASAFACRTVTAADLERHHDPFAGPHRHHLGTHVDDLSDTFVTEMQEEGESYCGPPSSHDLRRTSRARSDAPGRRAGQAVQDG